MAELPPNDKTPLSNEELRVLARRHERILRKFRLRRERETARREQQALAYECARQMAGIVSSIPNPRSWRMGASSSVPVAERLPNCAPETKSESHRETYPEPRVPFLGSHFEVRPRSSFMRWMVRIGGGSLIFSIAFHLFLIVCALFWVVSVYVKPPEAPEEFFATGSGGGRGGDRPSYADVQARRRAAGKVGMGAQAHKIVSKAQTSKLILPEVSMPTLSHSLSGNLSSAAALRGIGGDLSSGSGGGLGGGIGKGMGIGIGNTRNYVGKFKTTQKILGTNVTAQRLAVYMDNSGSMTAVIPVVREEILKKFPTADVYEFMGCGMGKIRTREKGGAVQEKMWEQEKARLLKLFDKEKTSSKVKSARKRFVRNSAKKKKHYSLMSAAEDEWKEFLSSYGKRLLEIWGNRDYFGLDMGNWLEMCFSEGGYDAIIVFADFQDYRDGQRPEEKMILERWLAAIQRNGQRVYFFTTEMMPATIFKALAVYSDGDIALPDRVSKGTDLAAETEKMLKDFERARKKNGRSLIDLKSQDSEEDDVGLERENSGEPSPAEFENDDEIFLEDEELSEHVVSSDAYALRYSLEMRSRA